jgi:hypothetical protein
MRGVILSNVARRHPVELLLAILSIVPIASIAGGACAGLKPAGQSTGGAGGAGAGATGGVTGTDARRGSDGLITVGRDAAAVDAPPPLTDFPTDPVIATPAVPSDAPGLFGGASRTGSQPCIASPQDGTLMPKNWLRPRFELKPAADENLFEIRLQVARFTDPLVIYTTELTYVLDAALWDQLRTSVLDEVITVSVRAMTLSSTGAVSQAPSAPAQSTFTIAPVDAPGKIVYWSLLGDGSNGTSVLKGFGIGEESVAPVLAPSQVQNRNTTSDGCIGCHTATPDGQSVGIVFGPPASMIGLDTYYDNLVDIRTDTAGTIPTYVTPAAMTTISGLRGIPAYSKAHWSDSDRIVLLTDASNNGDLRWVQLDGDQQGLLMRNGDARGAVEPTFSHDGTKIVYVSTSSIHDGRLDSGPADLYWIPYADRAGGAATPVTGASDPDNTEYYPAFSPNDDLVAFTRVAGAPGSYANNQSELYVVPSAGGDAVRLVANDPPACLYQHSPGLTNDWSKWSPDASTAANGKTYDWLTFSSTRSGVPQLYVTAVVSPAGGGAPQTYPALYLWNQPSTESNHTPSWDNYDIPPIVIVP